MIPYMLMPNSYLIKRDKFKIVNRVGVGVGRWSHAKRCQDKYNQIMIYANKKTLSAVGAIDKIFGR